MSRWRRLLVPFAAVLLAMSGVVAASLATSSPAAAAGGPAGLWTAQSPSSSPTSRVSPATAYDSTSGQVVLFGGYNVDTTLNQGDTWTWDGSTWTEQSSQSSPGYQPAPRSDAAMADDPADGGVLMFGGLEATSCAFCNDTEVWNGGWTEKFPSSSPSDRGGEAMAYDPATGQVVLFGGFSGTADLGDTWVWQNDQWTEQTPSSSPSARAYASMAYDQATDQLVLFGGFNGSTNLDDTWVWTGSSWVQQLSSSCSSACPSSPPARGSSSLAADPSTGALVLFGGSGSSDLADTWTWTGSAWQQQSVSPSPPARFGLGLASDPAADEVVLFGGESSANTYFGDTWTWQGSPSWGVLEAPGAPGTPPPRTYTQMAPTTGGADVLFGGYGSSVGNLNDTWVWNRSWSQPIDAGCSNACTSSPPARSSAAMAYDPASGQTILFGGDGATGIDNDTWAYDNGAWSQLDDATDPGCATTCASSPPAMYGASMAYDPSGGGRLLLFGGYSPSTGYLDQTWAWDGSSWSELAPATSPPSSYDGEMSYDPATGQDVLWVDYDTSTAVQQTWVWNGSTWSEETTPTSPPAQPSAQMSYDPAIGQVVLLDTSGNTWTWNGTGWTELSPSSSPPAEFTAGMAPAPGGGVLIAGGSSGGTDLFAQPPGAPSGAAVAAGDSTATVSWSPTTVSGGAPVDNYVVAAATTPSGAPVVETNVPATAASAVLAGLSNFSTYYVTVQAVSAIGVGPAAGPVIVTPLPVPASAPTALAASPTGQTGQVALSWDPPGSSGGAAITGYEISSSTASGAETPLVFDPVSGSPSTFGYTVNGLSDGVPYYFTVAAVTAAGAGASSSEASAVPITTASPPSGLQATAGDTVVALRWDPPSSDGGSAVTGYIVTATSTAGTSSYSVAATSDTVTGLSDGTSYSFTVAAVNGAGDGPASTSVTATPAATSLSATLSASSPTVASVETVPMSAVPAASLSSATSSSSQSGSDAAGLPLGAIGLPLGAIGLPLGAIGLSTPPLGTIQLQDLDLPAIAALAGSSDAGLAAAGTALSGIPISDLSIAYPAGCSTAPGAATACTGWNGVLAGTGLEGLPPQSVTLGEVLTASATSGPGPADLLGSSAVGALGLTGSPLASLPVDAVALAGVPLYDLELPGTSVASGASAQQTESAVLAQWCSELTTIASPYSCAELGIDPSTPSSAAHVDLLVLALAGVPLGSLDLSAISVASIPLGAIGLPLGAIGLPLGAIGLPLGAIPLSSVPLTGTALGQVPVASIPLSQSPLGAVRLGAAGLPLGAIGLPLGAIGLPLGAIPLDTVALSSLPVGGLSLGSMLPSATGLPLGAIGLPLGAIPLNSIPLSTIGLPLGAIGLPLGAIPLDEVSLSTASGPTAFAGLPLGAISLGAAGLPLGAISLDSIPAADLSTLVDCSLLSGCDASAIAGLTLASAEALGDLLPTATLGELIGAVGESNPAVAGTTLGELGYYGTANLQDLLDDVSGTAAIADVDSTTLSQLGTYAGTTLGELIQAIDKGQLGSAAQSELAATTLAELGHYGSTTLAELVGQLSGTPVLDSTTVAEILAGDDTTVAGYPQLTIGDLLLSLEPAQSYPWQSVDLSKVPLAASESAGGSEVFTTHLEVGGAGGTVDLTATLPPGFAYVPSSSTLDGGSAPDPTTASGGSLQWQLAALAPGPHSFSFGADAGSGLGEVTASVSAALDGLSGASSSASAAQTVQVVDGFTADAPLQTSTLNFGYIAAAGQTEDWTIPVSQGQELALALTNLASDDDIELFAPLQLDAQLQGPPAAQLPPVADAVPALSPADAVQATPGSNDLPVTPPPGYQLYAITNTSATPQDYADHAGTENIQTQPLSAGTYIVQVSGYNGATSSSPYVLQAELLGGGTTATCAAPSFLSGLSTASHPVQTSIPNGANTLFLLDGQRMDAANGAGSSSAIVNTIDALNGVDGVVPGVVAVDSYAPIETAYGKWNADPCSVEAANGVVTAIDTEVAALRAEYPSVTSIVVVGADDQIPFARLADGTVIANERDYAAGTFVDESNIEADALAEGYYFSDDPYASAPSATLGLGQETLYLPTAAIGRLIETPGDIEAALTRFVSSNGVINDTSGLTTGYSFLSSGAALVATNLSGDGVSSMTQLINDTWSTSALAGDLTGSGSAPGVASVNAHFDFSRALAADGNVNDLFTTGDVASSASSYLGRLLFSMGCHSGLDVDQLEVGPSGVQPAQSASWASTFAAAGALWVANTGYGYGPDSETLPPAYSTALMADFAGDLGSLTVGQSLAAAAQQYAGASTLLSPYDVKAIMESTLYGLPMYRLGSSSPSSGPGYTPPATGTDPVSGLTDAPVTLSQPLGTGDGHLVLESGPANTSYYELQTTKQVGSQSETTGSIEQTEYRPIEPLASTEVTEPSLESHGALVTGLTSVDQGGFDPTIVQPETDTTAPQLTESDTAFPGSLQRVATTQSFGPDGTSTHQQLDVVTGQFIPTSGPGTVAGSGTQRLFTSVSAEVLYAPAPLAADTATPTVVTSAAYATSGGTSFSVTVSPGQSSVPVRQVLVLYADQAALASGNPVSWTPLELSSSDGVHWSGAGPASAGGTVSYFVQAVDAAGNVAESNDQGVDFSSGSAPSLSNPAVTISLAGPSVTSGSGELYYTGPVTASVALAGGATGPLSYVLDGGAPTTLPSGTTQLPAVSGDGLHTVTVTAVSSSGTPVSSTTSFDIDALGPSVELSTTPSAVGGWLPGKVGTAAGTTVEVATSDGGARITSLTYSESGAQTVAPSPLTGPALPLTANGTTTVTVTAADAAGKTATVSESFEVDAGTPRVSCSPSSSSRWVDENVTVSCTARENESGLAADPSLYPARAGSPSASFTLSTTVAPGQADGSAMTPGATVCNAVGGCTVVPPQGPFAVDLAPPTITITTPPSGAVYTLGEKVKASYSCADVGSGIKHCERTDRDDEYLDTGTVGLHHFGVTAVDRAGNVSTETVSYTVTGSACDAAHPHRKGKPARSTDDCRR